VKPGAKFTIVQNQQPSHRLLLRGLSDVTCWDVDIDTTPIPVRSFAAHQPLTNRDALELYFSSLQVEKYGILNSSSVKYYELLAAWLSKYAAIVDRTPKATNAKLKKPDDCVWVKPKRRDLFRTDNTSVFMSSVVLDQTDSSGRHFKLKTSVADLNLAYLRFCHVHEISQ
jgi:hypothetical protein